jgi:hypothetical protein
VRAIAATCAMDSDVSDFAETDADILTFDVPDDALERKQGHRTWGVAARTTAPRRAGIYPARKFRVRGSSQAIELDIRGEK